MAGGTDVALSVPLHARMARPIGAATPRGVRSRAEARVEPATGNRVGPHRISTPLTLDGGQPVALIGRPKIAAAPNLQDSSRSRRLAFASRDVGAKAAAPNRIRDHRGSREGVQDGYAGRLVVGHVAGNDGEAVHQRRRGDLLTQRILCM